MNELPVEESGGKPTWSKPRLTRVGTIRDIAVRDFPLNQAANSKRS